MEAIDKVRDTSTSHERCSIIEVMGRNAGYIALWCGIANGAEDILLPELYNFDEAAIIDNIIKNRKRGKKHHIIINAEGVGHSTSMAKRIEALQALRPAPPFSVISREAEVLLPKTESMRLLWEPMLWMPLWPESPTG